MITWEKMTQNQKDRYLKFKEFYNQETIEKLGSLLFQYEMETMNSSYYDSYQTIVEKTAKLLKELHTDNPLLASIAFEYLLWGGYFSTNETLKYTLSDRINNLTVPGADIMRGKSVCLNNADMLADILTKMGEQAYPIACYIPKNFKLDKIEKPNIERQVEKKVSLGYKIAAASISLLMRRIGNHAVTFIKSNDTFYVSDPTNLVFANVTDFLKMKYVGTEAEIELKPWLSLIIGDMPEYEFTHFFLEAMVLSDKPVLTKDLVDRANNVVIELYRNNEPLLRDFHDDITTDIEIVSKSLKKEKNKQ